MDQPRRRQVWAPPAAGLIEKATRFLDDGSPSVTRTPNSGLSPSASLLVAESATLRRLVRKVSRTACLTIYYMFLRKILGFATLILIATTTSEQHVNRDGQLTRAAGGWQHSCPT